MSSIFLSHNHADKPFVRRFAQDLQAAGVRVWLDEAEMLIGDSLIEKIRQGIDEMEYLGVVLSQNSVKSEWVKREVDVAMNQEIEGKRVKILPLVIENCELPGFLKGKLYADFRDPQRYEEELKKILRRLAVMPPKLGQVQAQITQTTIQKFDQEIDYRLEMLPMLLEDVFTFTQRHTVQGAVYGEAEYHPSLGKFGEFEPLFPEFLGKSLFSLIGELQQLLPDQEKQRLKPALEFAKELPSFFSRLVLLVPVGNEDSKWQMDRKYLQKYKEVLKGFVI